MLLLCRALVGRKGREGGREKVARNVDVLKYGMREVGNNIIFL